MGRSVRETQISKTPATRVSTCCVTLKLGPELHELSAARVTDIDPLDAAARAGAAAKHSGVM